MIYSELYFFLFFWLLLLFSKHFFHIFTLHQQPVFYKFFIHPDLHLPIPRCDLWPYATLNDTTSTCSRSGAWVHIEWPTPWEHYHGDCVRQTTGLMRCVSCSWLLDVWLCNYHYCLTSSDFTERGGNSTGKMSKQIVLCSQASLQGMEISKQFWQHTHPLHFDLTMLHH